MLLPNARLGAIADAGHAPWIEAGHTVFPAITTLFDGGWPESASKAESADAPML
jgi:pimeloyl-ACP methyl ester carboxylesterase